MSDNVYGRRSECSGRGHHLKARRHIRNKLGGFGISKKQNRIELEDKLQLKSRNCPYCHSEMLVGYIGSGYPIIWGDKVKMGFLIGGKDGEALTGLLLPTDQIPSFKCSNCGILISQYK